MLFLIPLFDIRRYTYTYTCTYILYVISSRCSDLIMNSVLSRKLLYLKFHFLFLLFKICKINYLFIYRYIYFF